MSLPLGPVFSVLPFASIKSFDADTEKKLCVPFADSIQDVCVIHFLSTL
jgi:hypothetical protein